MAEEAENASIVEETTTDTSTEQETQEPVSEDKVEETSESNQEKQPAEEKKLPVEPTWWDEVLSRPPMPEQEQQPEQVEEQQQIDPSELNLTDKDIQVIRDIIRRETGELGANTDHVTSQLQQLRDQYVDRVSRGTLEHVRNKLYNDEFAKDPVFQGNEDAAKALDSTVKEFIQHAVWKARELNNLDNLMFVQHPKFGSLLRGALKGWMGLENGSTPATIDGGEVESGVSSSKSSSALPFKLTQSDREAMKKYGLTEKDIREAHEVVGNDYSDYDNEEV